MTVVSRISITFVEKRLVSPLHSINKGILFKRDRNSAERKVIEPD